MHMPSSNHSGPSVALLALMVVLLFLLAGRDHVIVLVDAREEHYAVGAASARAARDFIEAVLRMVRDSGV